MQVLSRYFSCLTACALLLSGTADAVTIDWIPIGNAGNAGDVQSQGTFGAVSYAYRIGKYEVTNDQYTEFLNAKAATNGDALKLYYSSMGLDEPGGINRTGAGTVGDPYVYTVKPGRGSNPVVFVNFYTICRFANWLDNGQGNGDTESGAYTLLGGTPVPSNADTISRNAGAKVFVPTEDEWYKAAYHKNDGVTGNYWDYATSTDSRPYSDQPPGSDAPTQSNTANFKWDDGIANGYDDGYAVTGTLTHSGTTNYLTNVGAYTLSVSAYGTFDQGGNVQEWNETLIGYDRGVRGGDWDRSWAQMQASDRWDVHPINALKELGFRLASIPEGFSPPQTAVPEPGTLMLGLIGAVALVMVQWRRSRKCAF